MTDGRRPDRSGFKLSDRGRFFDPWVGPAAHRLLSLLTLRSA